MQIYFDVCCLNRPHDDHSQDRVRLEAEAVLAIFARVLAGELTMVGSEILNLEIGGTPDVHRREALTLMLKHAGRTMAIVGAERSRADVLGRLGFQIPDAMHIAFAEAAGVGVFLTTDDRLLRLAARHPAEFAMHIVNPRTWIGGSNPP